MFFNGKMLDFDHNDTLVITRSADTSQVGMIDEVEKPDHSEGRENLLFHGGGSVVCVPPENLRKLSWRDRVVNPEGQ